MNRSDWWEQPGVKEALQRTQDKMDCFVLEYTLEEIKKEEIDNDSK